MGRWAAPPAAWRRLQPGGHDCVSAAPLPYRGAGGSLQPAAVARRRWAHARSPSPHGAGAAQPCAAPVRPGGPVRDGLRAPGARCLQRQPRGGTSCVASQASAGINNCCALVAGDCAAAARAGGAPGSHRCHSRGVAASWRHGAPTSHSLSTPALRQTLRLMPQVLSELEQSLESALQRFAALVDTRQLAPDASSSPAFSCSLPFMPGFAPRAMERRPRAQKDSHRPERGVCDASSLPCLSLRVGFALRTSLQTTTVGQVTCCIEGRAFEAVTAGSLPRNTSDAQRRTVGRRCVAVWPGSRGGALS